MVVHISGIHRAYVDICGGIIQNENKKKMFLLHMPLKWRKISRQNFSLPPPSQM